MINYITYPAKDKWKELTQRPFHNDEETVKRVSAILEDVKKRKDAALREYSLTFDKVSLENFEVSEEEISQATNLVYAELKKAIKQAIKNIETFHAVQKEEVKKVETQTGVVCWRKSVAIENIGLYIPGGSAPLFYTVLMLAVPAKLADCNNIFLCTPPGKDGKINPAILFAASETGIHKIFKVGGAQAIAAMAF